MPCPEEAPVCVGYIQDSTYGTCQQGNPLSDICWNPGQVGPPTTRYFRQLRMPASLRQTQLFVGDLFTSDDAGYKTLLFTEVLAAAS